MAVRVYMRYECVACAEMRISGGFVCLGQFLHQYLSGTKSLGSFPNP